MPGFSELLIIGLPQPHSFSDRINSLGSWKQVLRSISAIMVKLIELPAAISPNSYSKVWPALLTVRVKGLLSKPALGINPAGKVTRYLAPTAVPVPTLVIWARKVYCVESRKIISGGKNSISSCPANTSLGLTTIGTL